MANTKIEWAEAVWNPITGCSKISPGCANCYAERMSKRLVGRCGYPADEPFKVTVHPDKFVEPLRWRKPKRVFVCSMGDLFHPDVKDEWILASLVAMGLTYEHTGKMKEVSPGHHTGIYKPKHTFMILTKRPERMKEFFNRLYSKSSDKEWENKAHNFATQLASGIGSPFPMNAIFGFYKWLEDGFPGLWLGVTAENQEQADKRIPILLEIPAAVRFVSVEPMLGPVDLTSLSLGSNRYGLDFKLNSLTSWETGYNDKGNQRINRNDEFESLDWVICGGETGPGARPMHPDWVRSLRDQCQGAGMPFFFKQWGDWIHTSLEESQPFIDVEKEYDDSDYFIRVGKKKAGRILDGRTWEEFPEVMP
ncbi:DUF5131 family protein [Desulfotomaculum sp. 1211_IL3151]|uniref:DUF5131 family protein n=1 Tax=Desulfotomaculum sp. 1211_IL3151 TaxID=3084055 RepID=UPI002FDAD19F